MPIYEYRRPDGTTFEVQQSFSDDPLKVDPDTGVPVERVLHPPAVHFKGKGFYNTDYGTRARQRETAAAAAAEKAGGEKAGGEKSSSEKSSGEKSSGEKPSGGDGAAKGSSDGKRADSSKPAGSKPVAAKS